MTPPSLSNIRDRFWSLLPQGNDAASQTDDPAGGSLLIAAMESGLEEDQIARAFAAAAGLRYVEDLSPMQPSEPFAERVPIGFARRHAVLGFTSESEDDRLPVAIPGPDVCEHLDIVSRFLDQPVEPILAPRSQILAKINAVYQQRDHQAQRFIDNLGEEVEVLAPDAVTSREDLLDVSDKAPVIQLVNAVFFEAVKLMASDVHIQPYEDRLVVRMRIDGVLSDMFDLPKPRQEEVISRIKVMGRMDIAEKRIAQDGRATVQVGDRLIDLRISAIPSSLGERVVIRLLDKSSRLYTLEELGMDAKALASFQKLIKVEHGLILVTGPTGSGKSTTLYAALQEIDAKQRNILTLEDPIEFQLDGISQTQVSEKKGMTFADGLRSVLRQDPDVIMVGEIRDHETAVMAIQSALTGHLVFSTLHTNDAASAVTRLLDLGIEPYLVASSVVGVLAQRLVRRVCSKCGQPDPDAADRVHQVGLCPKQTDTSGIMHGTGCDACRHTGHRGRIGVFELLAIDETVRQQVQARATATSIKLAAVEKGMDSLADDAVHKMLAGVTTLDEVMRVAARMES